MCKEQKNGNGINQSKSKAITDDKEVKETQESDADDREVKETQESDNDDAKEHFDNNKGNGVLKEILSWVKVFVVAFIVAFILSNYVIVNARIPSASMKNTINEGDKVIGFRLSYMFSNPKRGDIVMFYAPDKENTIYIKRVIGVPGDRIVIQDNKLYINDELITENYIENPWTKNKGTSEFDVIPEDEYFMMGDNRDNSNDSRVWGTVKKSKIIAKAIFRYYPSFKKFN